MCAPDLGIHQDILLKNTSININLVIEGQWITRAVRVHPLVNMKACTKFHGALSTNGGPTDQQWNPRRY